MPGHLRPDRKPRYFFTITKKIQYMCWHQAWNSKFDEKTAVHLNGVGVDPEKGQGQTPSVSIKKHKPQWIEKRMEFAIQFFQKMTQVFSSKNHQRALDNTTSKLLVCSITNPIHFAWITEFKRAQKNWMLTNNESEFLVSTIFKQS